jgi:hypothetical protein
LIGLPCPDQYAGAVLGAALKAGSIMAADDDTDTFTTAFGHTIQVDETAGVLTVTHTGGATLKIDASGVVTLTTSGACNVEAATVTLSAASVTVNAAQTTFSGVIQADTLIANSVVASSYTPGAGNQQ